MILSTWMAGCKKFVEIPPPKNLVVTNEAFADDQTALATLNGLYSRMSMSASFLTTSGVALYAGLSADELYYYSSGTWDEFRSNRLSARTSGLANNFWSAAYSVIYGANSCIAGAGGANILSENIQNQIIGESMVIRSFMYFQLLNLFGPVPLITGTDYEVSQNIARADTAQVWQQISTDLEKAIHLLSAQYPSANRARINKPAAEALLARTCLYRKQWAEARKWSDSVVATGLYSLPEDLNQVFLTSSNEVIWQLSLSSTNGYNCWDAYNILPSSASSAPKYLITEQLAAAFEPGDKRKSAWLASRTYKGKVVTNPFKYKIRAGLPATESQVNIRLAEILLIRAEASAWVGDLLQAEQDLNAVRQRAGLERLEFLSKVQLQEAILQERRVELFSEWGHRWYDLKRTGRADAVLSAIKEKDWQATDELWPIPESELLLNTNLKQNEGY